MKLMNQIKMKKVEAGDPTRSPVFKVNRSFGLVGALKPLGVPRQALSLSPEPDTFVRTT